MPAVLSVSTAIAPPLLSAGLVAAQFLRSLVCTDVSTLPGPGTPAIQGGRQRQPSPSQPVPSWVGGDPVMTNYMAQVLNLLLQQCALRGLELQTSSSKSVKHLSEPIDMSAEVGGDDNDIIEIDEQDFPV